MVRGVSITLIIFLVAFAIGSLIVVQRSSDSRVLRQNVIDGALKITAPQAGDSTALDSPSADTHNTRDATIDTYRQQAQTQLLWWCGWSMIVGVVISLACLFYIFNHEKSVHGPQGAGAAQVGWLIFLVILLAGAGGLAFFELHPFNPTPLISSDAILVCVLFFVLLQLLGYYLSTALGVSKLMRPSVPLAPLFLRAG